MATMSVEAISDQKRLVRAEYWLRARSRLRARDQVHHRPWKVMMIAGPSPAEEIRCIRACMHQAHITAVDLDQSNILKAIDAGADEAFVCDIGDLQFNGEGAGKRTVPPAALENTQFDVINLDLTGPANNWLQRAVACYYRALVPRGAMMVTFSYGRDVVEAQSEEWDRMLGKAKQTNSYYGGAKSYSYPSYHDSLVALKDIPEPIAIRVWCALGIRCTDLESCIQYRGHRMPMIACLIAKGRPLLGAKFLALSSDDLQFAVLDEQLNLSNLYACPVERIEAFRRAFSRKLAAHKAVRTRRQRQKLPKPKPETPLLTYDGGGPVDDDNSSTIEADGREQQD